MRPESTPSPLGTELEESEWTEDELLTLAGDADEKQLEGHFDDNQGEDDA